MKGTGWVRFLVLVVLLASLVLGGGHIYRVQAEGAPVTVVLGIDRAQLANASAVQLSDSPLGKGAWWFNKSATKMELYIDPTMSPFDDILGSFTIDDIASISYQTKKPGGARSVDFFLAIYTAPDGNDDTAGWYGYRLNAEPYFSNNLNAPANTWNTWSTAAGSNQLTFFDTAKTGGYGFYGQPTLQDLQAGAINWSSIPNCAPSCVNQSIDYGAETVKYISIQTGSSWSSTFEGYLDNLSIRLKDGKKVTIDFEAFYDQTWVDDNAGDPWYLVPGHFKTIQSAIDATAPDGTVYVYPGDYHEKATNRKLFNNSGPYQFGLFIGQDKAGLKVIGVDEDGDPITDYENVGASVTTYATNSFGYSGIFVEADNVTLQGLEIKDNIVNDQVSNNKTIEVIGDNFTLRYCHINVGAGEEDGGSVYIGDWRFDENTSTSHIRGYILEYNWFDHGTSVDIANGAGISGDVWQRQIVHNKFTNDPDDYWPFISFNGSGTGVPWFVYSVGGATIKGNNFTYKYKGIGPGVAHIRARGTYDNSQFDWASYWQDNTFNQAVVAGSNPPADLSTYSYVSGTYQFDNVRRIGVTIQNEVEKAANGDTVLVKPGTYEEQVVISGKALTLQGAGQTPEDVVIKSPTTLTAKFTTTSVDNKPVVLVQSNADVTLSNLKVDGAGNGKNNYRFVGIGFYNAGGTVEGVTITGVREDPFSGTQHGLGLYAYNGDGQPRTLTVRNVAVSDFQKNGITVVGSGLEVTIENNEVTGAGSTNKIAQNGIQVSYGAAGTVRNNTITGIAYSGNGWVASGILVYGAGSTTVEGNTLTNSQANIYVVESSATIRGNRIGDPACVGGGCYGIVASDPLTARPSPLEEALTTPALPGRSGTFASLSATNPLDVVTVTANEIRGTAYPSGESVGLGIYEGYADRDLSVSASQNVISGWSHGVYVGACSGDDCRSGRLRALLLNENAITRNGVGMATELSLGLNAERNWWGSPRGPRVASNPGGDGQSLQGSGIDYVPWLCDGTDAQPDTIGFQPLNNVATCTNTATRLRFVVQPPATAFTNEPFDPQPVVRVEDDAGNLAINYDYAVLIALDKNPAGGQLGGTLSADPVNGLASFTDLYLNKAGTGYRLIATSGNLYPARSIDFSVLDPSADLAVSLSAPASVNAGADFAYTLTVSNAGPKPANTLTLTLSLPTGVTYRSAGGSGWTCSHSAGTVTCTLGSLAKDATSTLVVNVTAPAQAGDLTASASLQAASPPDTNPANNSASASTTVVVLPPTGGVQVYLPLIMR